MAAFEGFDYVVAPSGSCAAMLKLHYPRLMSGDDGCRSVARGRSPSACTSLSRSSSTCAACRRCRARFAGRVTYHDGCSGLRELKIKQQPRRLLAAVQGLELIEMPGTETCCGFGGLFSVKFPDISNAMVSAKTANIDGVAAGVGAVRRAWLPDERCR